MPLLVRKNIRTLGRRELLGPILTVENDVFDDSVLWKEEIS
jgi:hypothetical protein